MSAVLKSSLGVGPITKTPPASCRLSGDLYAGENIAPGDACYIKSDGAVYRSIGAVAGDPSATVRGFAPAGYQPGEAITLFRNVNFDYSDGLLTPGANLYLSATVPGGLDTAPSTGGTGPVAFVVDTCRIHPHGSTY